MSLLSGDVRVAVSSVLNRDTKQYGKKFMFDGNDDTCWNSDQGEDQWIKIAFDGNNELTSLAMQMKIQFQGGFSCKLCRVALLDRNGQTILTCDCYPEDVNSVQNFPLEFKGLDQNCDDLTSVSVLRISFKNTTDFFGRVTVYYLDIIQTG